MRSHHRSGQHVHGGNATGSTGVVKGEWSTITSRRHTTAGVTTTTQSLVSTTMNCLNDTSTPCGNSLGNTYGIPQIRRFHNGSWGAVFGNGLGSVSGDAGIFVMLVNPSSATGAVTFYYLSTARGSASNPNGIAYVTPADLDGTTSPTMCTPATCSAMCGDST